MMEKIKYITNKELLIEIHKSKSSYCYFEKPEYGFYDAIVDNVDKITPEFIQQTYEKQYQSAIRKKESPPVLENLVFRVMTSEHIPEEDDLKKRKRNSEDTSIKTSFPPFKHYIMENGSLREVGRSHWKNGEFSKDHGKITNRLARMMMLLIERYSKKGSWRNYCVDEATEALTQRGWLSHNEITEDDIILSYDLSDRKLKWSKINSIYRNHDYEDNMFHLTVNGMDALVTPHHKFITNSGFKYVEMLLETDKIILMGDAVETNFEKKYSDAFVELVGWVATEGNFYIDNTTHRSYPRISISQNEGVNADRIRNCLSKLNENYGDGSRTRSKNNLSIFTLQKEMCLSIDKVLDNVGKNKALKMEFILDLTEEQRELLIDTMIAGDGWLRPQPSGSNYRSYVQKDKGHVDSFVALCALSGYQTSCKLVDIVSFGKPTQVYIINLFSTKVKHCRVENVDFHGGKNSGGIKGRGKAYHPNKPTIPYKGTVWCPSTEYGTFMYRRNGYVYTGANSYNDEMQGQAIVQLAEVCLRFDESKSDTPNPFSFYTTIIKHSFTRCLNSEKKVQHIRDDLLIMHDKSPSYTRQVEHEADRVVADAKIISTDSDGGIGHNGGPPMFAEPKEVVLLPKKRGRKPRVDSKINTVNWE